MGEQTNDILDEGNANIVGASSKKRKIIPFRDLLIAKAFIDDYCPFQSGRDYRLRKKSYKTLYKLYVNFVKSHKGRILSISTLYRLIIKDKLRTNKDQIVCPHCQTLNFLNILLKLSA